MGIGRPTGSMLERFMAKVSPEPNSGCWLWCGKGNDRYGQMRLGRKTEGQDGAHRISYSLFRGVIPVGAQVLHRCDNSWCVNPDHLRAGSAQENMDDRTARGRWVPRTGEDHPGAKLTAAAIADIKTKARHYSEYAAVYGVSKWTIFDVQSGRRWRTPA